MRDFYGDYELPSFESVPAAQYVSDRRQYAVNSSWQSDLKQELGKASKDADKGGVQFDIPVNVPPAIKGIIGEGQSSIRVTGSRSIMFSGRSEWEDGLVNTGTFKQSKFPVLQMEQKSQFKVTGSIGSKITVEVDQDSQRDVELANTIKLRYKGEEDEILQTVEAGNTSLSLPNAQYIGYTQNVQGLFGIKSTARIGNLDLTMITSQEKGTSEKATFSAGAKGRPDTIMDYQYLVNTYFWLGSDTNRTDRILAVDLYLASNDQNDLYGIACANPADTLPYISPEETDRSEFEYRYFKLYDPTKSKFEIYKYGWYLVLDQPLQVNDVLAAYIKFLHYPDYPDTTHADTVTVGNLHYHPAPDRPDSTMLVLKLLKASQPLSTFTTWNRTWRNVYDLGARNISSDGFELKIFKGRRNINDPEDQDGRCFVTLLGVDRLNNNDNRPGSDCIFDFNNTTLDAVRGHLIFPLSFPFMSDSLQVKVPAIYRYGPELPFIRDSSTYYIYVKTSQRASSFSLGRANIMENSEVVKLGDGTILRRGTDYEINYDIGQITFRSEQAMNPGANVSVDYEYAPFFMPEKKSLFGMAGQYKFWENSNISLAAMYRSESASEPRPRVGREPRRGFIWDSNFSFSFKPDLMTRLVDVLPLVEADAPSGLDITGEVAQSFPNPNTKNQAFIDDFEGSRSYTDFTPRRGLWAKCSPPMDSIMGKLDLAKRGSIWWYNPWQIIGIKDIWPDASVKAQDNRQDVLFLDFFPDTLSAHPESSWTGIMRPFMAGLADQSLMKFIEVWYYSNSDSNYILDDPILHIDLGMISEDIDDNGFLNTEDRPPGQGAHGVFEPDQEDTGLDGVFDPQETGYNPDANPDPHGDDWHYENGSDDYSRINGTEGNKDDPDRLGRFDTEDINNNGTLDIQDGYFEYVVHMNNPAFLADSTRTGWKLLRIPFRDSTVYKILGTREAAQFSRINFARLWLTGAAHPYTMAIASFQLVGNKWQELSFGMPSGDTLRTGEKFEVTVKNTQENAGYEPPPGVAGELNRDTGIREKEQSLVLVYHNMPLGHVGGAAWNLYQAEDYTQYQKMTLFVHGDSSFESGVNEGLVTFFFRLSTDGNNYYEYHTVLEPGWSQNNEVEIDFARMTGLKYAFQRGGTPDSLADPDTTDGKYSVEGNPSLSQVRMFIAGVEIAAGAAGIYSGEVWLDELRVTDVRRKSDFAGRLQAVARFSDFFDLTLAYNRMGADFFPLSARTPSGATNTGQSVRLNVKADKLLPPSLGLSLPVSVSWQKTVALPRLKPGSDIILTGASRDLERTENTTLNYSFSHSFNKNTNSWLWNLALNRIRTSYSFSRSEGISPTVPISRVDTYRGTGNYDLNVKAKPSVKPLFWTRYLFLPGSFYNSQLFFLPTQLGFGGEVNGRTSQSVTQRGIPTDSRVKDLSLSGNTALALFSSMRTSYSLQSSRDISQPGRLKLSINPSKLKLGSEQSFQQRFETSFQPRIIQMIENRVTFTSSYAENSDIKRNPDSTRTTQTSGTLKLDLTFNIQSLFSNRGRPAPKEMEKDKGKPDEDREGRGDESEKKAEPGSGNWVINRFVGFFRSIKPLRGSYVKDKKLNVQGLLDRPSWQYLFGFADRTTARSKTTTGLGSLNSSVFSDNYNLGSGLQPGQGVDINGNYTLRKTVSHSSAEPLKTSSITFPDLTLNVSGLEKLSLFRKVSSTVTLQTGYTRKVDENGNASTGEKYKRDTAINMAPLAAINVTFKNNVRATLRYDLNLNISENLKKEGVANRDTRGTDNSLKLTLSYNLTAPRGLKLPFLKKVKFNSQLSLNLDITSRNTKSVATANGVQSVESQRSQLVVEPKLSYQFSRAITGSVRARWDDSNDKIQKRKHHIRELGISAEIRF
jgi:cell surface protein SprA